VLRSLSSTDNYLAVYTVVKDTMDILILQSIIKQHCEHNLATLLTVEMPLLSAGNDYGDIR